MLCRWYRFLHSFRNQCVGHFDSRRWGKLIWGMEAVVGFTSNLLKKNVFLNHITKYSLSLSSQKWNLMATDNTEWDLSTRLAFFLKYFFSWSVPYLGETTRQQFVRKGFTRNRKDKVWKVLYFLLMITTTSSCECLPALSWLSGPVNAGSWLWKEALSSGIATFVPKPDYSGLKQPPV